MSIEAALQDMLAGWRYIRERYGDLDGVGWDRVQHAAEEALAEQRCTWREDAEGNWQTDCGGTFVLFDDTPVENDMAYCCYCGKPLVEVEHTEPTMDDDA